MDCQCVFPHSRTDLFSFKGWQEDFTYTVLIHIPADSELLARCVSGLHPSSGSDGSSWALWKGHYLCHTVSDLTSGQSNVEKGAEPWGQLTWNLTSPFTVTGTKPSSPHLHHL